MRKILPILGGLWLGFSISFFGGIKIESLIWWVIVIPTLILILSVEKNE